MGRDRDFAPRHFRKLLGPSHLGLAHAVFLFLFVSDMLVTYDILGAPLT
jgi:uncharacterized membrane protein YeiB